MGGINWDQVVGAIVGASAVALLGFIGVRIVESRRKICFTASRVYFGPDLTYNTFMGRNYPHDDSIGLDCDIKFFSNKSLRTGLHNFRFELCRPSFLRRVVVLTVGRNEIYRDLLKESSEITLDTLELPPRQFVSFELRTMVGRDKWADLRQCDFVRLACETPEGKIKRFAIGRIHFPEMPPKGLRGTEYCSVQVVLNHPPDGRVVIAALRRQKVPGPVGQMPSREDTRYWSGTTWVRSIKEATVYEDAEQARADGEPIKIWDRVPSEWI